MDEFGYRIVKRLTVDGRRLSIVRTTDDFLLRSDTKEHLLRLGLQLVPIESAIKLRVRYEMNDKHSDRLICYVTSDELYLLPDMETAIYDCGTFSVADILPFYNASVTANKYTTYENLLYLYEKKYTFRLSEKETISVLQEAEHYQHNNAKALIERLKDIPIDWDKSDTIIGVSDVLCDIIRSGCYAEAEDALNAINDNFQSYIDTSYFALHTASFLKRPKMVNRVLPYIARHHERNEKVALVVIDGMTYWQYLILDKSLLEEGIQTGKEMVFSWLPSITKLSRQAIFRGDMPSMQYVQTPNNEKKLWDEFWKNKWYMSYETRYTHGSVVADDFISLRQAFVDISLDEKMHSSSDNKDLYDLTVNWSKEVAGHIEDLYHHGYHIYITTDHGNLLAHGWRQLDNEEKTFLYERESRGSRHLIYSKKEYMESFLKKNEDITDRLLVRDNWAVWREPQCFKTKDEITHGGAHFLEVVIPFISIEKKQ